MLIVAVWTCMANLCVAHRHETTVTTNKGSLFQTEIMCGILVDMCGVSWQQILWFNQFVACIGRHALHLRGALQGVERASCSWCLDQSTNDVLPSAI